MFDQEKDCFIADDAILKGLLQSTMLVYLTQESRILEQTSVSKLLLTHQNCLLSQFLDKCFFQQQASGEEAERALDVYSGVSR
jgi:hypothetical protein